MLENLFVIIGKSGSGKDTILREILKRNLPRFYHLVPYTTRAKRVGETDGKEYCFIDDREFEYIISNDRDEVLGLREYDVLDKDANHCRWVYFHRLSDMENDVDYGENYITINTLKGYEMFTKNKYIKDKLVPIFINVDDKELILRGIERESKNEYPNYLEVCNRFIKDNKDYDSYLKSDECTLDESTFKVIDNNEDVNNAIHEVYTYIINTIIQPYVKEEKKIFLNKATLGLIDMVNDDLKSIVEYQKSLKTENAVKTVCGLRDTPDGTKINPFISHIIDKGNFKSILDMLNAYKETSSLYNFNTENVNKIRQFDTVFISDTSSSLTGIGKIKLIDIGVVASVFNNLITVRFSNGVCSVVTPTNAKVSAMFPDCKRFRVEITNIGSNMYTSNQDVLVGEDVNYVCDTIIKDLKELIMDEESTN